MHEPTHAPGWRGRPRRYGPLEDDLPPRWLALLEMIAPVGCVLVALATLILVLAMFATDAAAGHL